MQSLNNQLKDLNKCFFALIVIIVIIITILNVKNNCDTREGWFVYKDQYFGSYQTGYTDEKAFYIRPEYRKPYSWPVGFKSEHPVKHISSLNPWA